MAGSEVIIVHNKIRLYENAYTYYVYACTQPCTISDLSWSILYRIKGQSVYSRQDDCQLTFSVISVDGHA